MVAAKAFAGDLRFNPETDSLTDQNGNKFKFLPPSGNSLPEAYEDTDHVYTPPTAAGENTEDVLISPTSDRLQSLKPFAPWNRQDYVDLPILIKVKGKCTTDHITPGGPWFRYRGHLENISNNTLIGAVNAETGLVNSTTNVFTGKTAKISETAKYYKER